MLRENLAMSSILFFATYCQMRKMGREFTIVADGIGPGQEAVEAAEKRLETTFPPSFRAWLANEGMHGLEGFGADGNKLLPAAEVVWLRDSPECLGFLDLWADEDEEQDSIAIDEHLTYGENQDSARFRQQVIPGSLLISDVREGFFFLCPGVRHGDEWEAWHFAEWYPGAARWRSFEDMLDETYRLSEVPESSPDATP